MLPNVQGRLGRATDGTYNVSWTRRCDGLWVGEHSHRLGGDGPLTPWGQKLPYPGPL